MPESQQTLDSMTNEIFQLYRLIAIVRSRRPAGQDDLSEAEFLTLDCLTRQEGLTIGDIQKQIGVLPAQMSRIVRALETQGGKGLVETRINAEDRRRINLALTEAGKSAYDQFKFSRTSSIESVLKVLSPEDRVEFMRMLRQIRHAFEDVVNKLKL